MVIKERRGRHDNIMSLRRSTAAAQQIKIIINKKIIKQTTTIQTNNNSFHLYITNEYSYIVIKK